MGNLKIKHLGSEPREETLQINKTAQRITATVKFLKFRDKDTRQIIVYVPSLEVTGYGATENKATEMVKFSVEEFFRFLLALSPDKFKMELLKLGWKGNKIKKKEFSKTFIDTEGNLKDFNAVGNEIEQGVLTL